MPLTDACTAFDSTALFLTRRRWAFTAETNRLHGAASARVAERARELAGVTAAIDRLVQAIVDGAPARAVTERIEALEARRSELEAAEAEDAAPPPVLHPAMAEVYRRRVGDLAACLSAPDARAQAADILRGLIEAIELHPAAEGYGILLRGDLAGILRLAADGEKPATVSGGGLSQMAFQSRD